MRLPKALASLAVHHRRTVQGDRADAERPVDPARIRKGVAVLVLTAVLVAALILAVPGLASIRTRLAHGSPGWLALAACFRLLSAFAYVALFRAIFAPKLSRLLSYRIGMSEIGTNALVPAGGTGGLALGAWVLHRRGMAWADLLERSAVLFVFTSAFNVGAVALLGWLGTVGLLASHTLWLISALPALVATVAIGLALAFASRLGGLKDRRDKARPHSWHWRLLGVAATVGTGVRGAVTLFRERNLAAMAAGTSYLVFDIVTLWTTLRAFHGHAALQPLGMGYLVGQLAGSIPIPGGVGAVGAGLIGALSLYGIPVTLATASTLAYRAIALGIPVLFGGLAAIGLARTVRGWAPLQPAKDSTSRAAAGAVDGNAG
jgi:uncharacterized membrane protein YbhN (UPF0104 family)